MSPFIDTRVDFPGFDQSYNNDETEAPVIHHRVVLKAVLRKLVDSGKLKSKVALRLLVILNRYKKLEQGKQTLCVDKISGGNHGEHKKGKSRLFKLIWTDTRGKREIKRTLGGKPAAYIPIKPRSARIVSALSVPSATFSRG